MSSFKARIAAVASFAVASGTALLMTAGAASAAATVPSSAITNDPNAANGTVSFYDSSGNQVYGGSDLTHLFDYALASTVAPKSPSTKATLYFAFPDHTKPDSQAWAAAQESPSTNFPNSSAPASLKSSPKPLVTVGASDGSYTDAAGGVTLDTTSGYAGIVQVRVFASGVGNPVSPPFWASDIYVDTTANTWQQVYPNPPQKVTPTISAITASPASPAASSTTTVGLSASVTAPSTAPAGSVELFNGSADLGPATYNAGTGAISATATVAAGTSYNFSFVLTPNDTTNFNTATSPVLAYTVKPVAGSTSTTLTGPSSATVGDTVNYVASVAAGNSALGAADGSVQFSVSTDGTTFSPAGAAVPLDSTGKATLAYNATAAGSISVKAVFQPADPTAYNTSTSNTVVTTVAAATAAPDPQNVTVTVPQGTLVISTPYTVANPLKMGTMTLNTAGTQYHASANFGDPAAPAATDPGSGRNASTSNGVTITDMRAGSTGWTASAQTTNFTNTGTTAAAGTYIDGNNLKFLNVTPKYLSGNGLQSGDVITNDITSNFKTKQAFAHTTKGPGTVNITGVLDLTAPTSTLPGSYTATITFTVA